ncbi:uncharacterized protein LOC135710043 [Ochlerotatus camptorhynchus]|uniref:uncharacterized protein LOC135710043 n=1 Tax=Ochlerotatus camptorhynchus TaxID=644619 RepID=UPI0031D156C1
MVQRRNHQFVSFRAQLASVSKEFYELWERIELLMDDVDDADADKETQEKGNLLALSSFEERYYFVKGSLLSKQTPLSSTLMSVGNGHLGDRSEASFSKVKLPEIRLPSFGGRIKEWVTFRDSSRSLIHENKQLTDMDRFSYLSVNYSVAWKALESRYENKKLIVKAHLDSLFVVEGFKRESYDGLSNLISVFEKNLQMLKKFGEETAAWSTILAYMVYSRLDPATLRQWEAHHNAKGVPTYENLIGFLLNHCAVLESVAPTNSIEKPFHSDQRSSKSSVCHSTVRSSS